MTKLRKIMDSVLKTISVFLFAFMTVTGTYQVLSRYLFGKPSTISEGLLSYSFAWMALLAAAYVFGKREHMRMSFITDKFSDSNQLKISLIGELFTFAFAVGALIYGGIAIVQLGMGQQSPSLGIQMGWVYMVIPVTGVITAVYNVMNIAELTQQIKTSEK